MVRDYVTVPDVGLGLSHNPGSIMPEEPPAARRIGKKSIIGMTSKEVTIVVAIGGASRGCFEGLR